MIILIIIWWGLSLLILIVNKKYLLTKDFYKLKIFNFSSKFTIILAEISDLKCEKIQQNNFKMCKKKGF